MKSDIEIAQAANMIPIWEVAEQLNIPKDELEMYGKYKAKLGDELWDRVKDNPDGKLILVTAINPTPAGEGKTTTSVGLGQAMGKLGKNMQQKPSPKHGQQKPNRANTEPNRPKCQVRHVTVAVQCSHSPCLQGKCATLMMEGRHAGYTNKNT